jgi:hypothetical protein
MNAWLSTPDDIQLAMSAAGALNHMADYFWHGFANSDPARVLNSSDITTFRRELAKKVHRLEFGPRRCRGT